MVKIKSIISAAFLVITVAHSAFGDGKIWSTTSRNGNFTASVIAFSTIQGSIATAPGYIELRDNNGKLLHTFKHSLVEAIISSVEFSPDGKLIASAAKTGGWPFRVRNEDWPSVLGEVRLWDTRTGELKYTLVTPKAQMLIVTFSPDGKTLAAAGGDGKIRLLDVSTRKLTNILLSSYTVSLKFSPDGQKLVTAVGDEKIRIWHVRTGKIWKILDAKKEDEKAKRILSVAFSPDGNTIASAGSDPLRWWDAKTGRLVKTFENTRRETYEVKEQTKLVFPATK